MHTRSSNFILTHSITALLLAGSAFAGDNLWVGATSNDWNDPSNWSLGRVPDIAQGDSAAVNISPANIATVSANVPQVIDLRVGEGDNTSGVVIHNAGTVSSGNTNWIAIGAGSNASGIYNLTSSVVTAGSLTSHGQGSGSVNANGRLYIGGTDDTAFSPGGTGILNINTTGGVNATDTVFVGARGSTGTVNIESGALNAINQRIYIGETGRGTVNVQGGTLSATSGDGNASRIYIGNNGGTGTLTVGGTGVVTTNSDLVMGSNGGTGTVTQSAGTINAGGWAYVGGAYEGANNTGYLNISGGTFNKGTGRLYVGVGNGTTVGHMTVSGSGAFTNTDQFIVGTGTTTSTVDVTGSGTLNSGSFYLGGTPNNDFGSTGHALMTINGANALVNVAGEMQIGRQNGSTGSLTITQGTLQTSSNLAIGVLAATGAMTVNGAKAVVNIGDQLWVGQDAASNGTLIVSQGTVSAASWIAVGRNASTGVLTISGTGVVQKSSGVGSLELTNFNVGGSATVNLDGGNLIVNDIVMNGGTTATAIMNFNGGTLTANADNTDFIKPLTRAAVKAGGLKIDTGGHNITINQAFVADTVSTGGGMTKSGAGNLTLTATETYTGATNVNSGKLILTDAADISTSSGIAITGGRGVTARTNVSNILLPGSVLFVEDGNGTNNNQFGNVPLTLNGGSLEYHGGQGVGLAVSSVTIATGGAIAAQPQFGGGLIQIGNLATNATGTSMASFISTYGTIGAGGNTADVGHVNLTTLNSLPIGNVVTAQNGIIGGWATTFSSPDNAGDTVTHFATHGANGVAPVIYNGNSIAGAVSTDNIQTIFMETVAGSKTINALETDDADISLDSGVVFTLNSGGLIFGGANHSLKGGTGAGSITAGALGNYKIFATVNDSGTDYRISDVAITNNIANLVTFVKGGSGLLDLNSANTYTGSTIVNSGTLKISGSIDGSTLVQVNDGATLLLGSNANKLKNTASLVLASGGTLDTGGFSEGLPAAGSPAQIGTLTLNTNSTISFGAGAAGGSSLLFAGLNYTPGDTISILNWTGAMRGDDGSSGNDRLLFTSSLSLTDFQLAGVQFYADDGSPFTQGAMVVAFNGYSEIVPVPEPSTAISLLSAAGLLAGLRRFRRTSG